MKKFLYFMFLVLCFAALNRCELWNKPLAEPLHIRSIFVSKHPSISEFAPGSMPAESGKWAELGLEISGINNMDTARVLKPEEYAVELPPDADLEAGEIPVTVRHNEYTDVITSFTIKVNNGEYEIDWFKDDNNNFVYTEPRIISEKEFDEDNRVRVKLEIIPAAGYEYIDGSLAYD
ncbi:MAG: hypothetical protein LBB22_00730 [Treponema sp.]|nr:hypothetical protein [Treponema sp.]